MGGIGQRCGAGRNQIPSQGNMSGFCSTIFNSSHTCSRKRLDLALQSAATHRRVILLLGSVCLMAALAGWWHRGRNAPRQDGLTANDWIELTARKRRTGYSDQDIQAASSALLKLGTNAFPALRSAFT